MCDYVLAELLSVAIDALLTQLLDSVPCLSHVMFFSSSSAGDGLPGADLRLAPRPDRGRAVGDAGKRVGRLGDAAPRYLGAAAAEYLLYRVQVSRRASALLTSSVLCSASMVDRSVVRDRLFVCLFVCAPSAVSRVGDRKRERVDLLVCGSD